MPNAINITKYNTLEKELYQRLGKQAFIFLEPLSTDTSFIHHIPKITNTYNKNKQKLQTQLAEYKKLLTLQNMFPVPVLLEEESPNIVQEVYEFLYSQHILQRIRWETALPEFAVYALEFFLPEMTEEQKAIAAVIKDVDDKLTHTLNISLPIALKTDNKGYFAPESTQQQEDKYHLIASKLAGITPLETISGYLHNKINSFPEWAFFVVNHQKELKDLSLILVQAIFDWLQIFAYQQLAKGINPTQAQNDALGYLFNEVNSKRLEQLIVFRAEEEVPLDLFILELLEELKINKRYVKSQTLKDLYVHILICLDKVIREGLFTVGTLLSVKIRESTDREQTETHNTHTVVVNPIIETGEILDNVQELYQVKLADEAFNNLLIYSMQGLKPIEYIY